MRLNRKQLNTLKKRYDVDRIWSFSRVNTIHNCLWEYWAKYIKHMKLDTGNVYTYWGTYSHDLIQSFITNKVTYHDMALRWDEYVHDWENDPNAFQFDSDKIKVGYISNLSHYFKHTDIPSGDHFEVEKPVLAKLGKRENGQPKYVFVGYVDTQYVDGEGNTVLIDYKTSSRSSFSKSKLPEKAKQLTLYAIAKHQTNGIPYNKIRCRFDMMKYVTVHYQQESGKWKESIQERTKWVSKMAKKLATKLRKCGIEDEQATELIQVASLSNSMEKLPDDVQKQFYITNYIIELPIDEEHCKKVAEEMEKSCDQIVHFESLSPEEQESYMESNDPYNPDDYYEKKLCAYHTSSIFKEKERTLDDLLEPQMADNDEDQLLAGILDAEDTTFVNIFEE